MKFTLPVLATLLGLSSFVFAQDGASGDGDCDPCDENCEVFSKRDIAIHPRMVEFNDTSGWEEGEISRWRKPAGADFDPAKPVRRYEIRAPLILEFNCGNVPEICLNMCYGWNCSYLSDDLL